jgi:short subunit dehydrogenase-like uncharacterized protein
LLQQAAVERFGKPLISVGSRIRATKGGGFSGGTAASLAENRKAAARDPLAAMRLADPFALCPGFVGPAQPDGHAVRYDERVSSWLAPFVMATINTKNVHRTNYLLGHPYGSTFTYDEMTMAGDGGTGRQRAMDIADKAETAANSPHKPGAGPSKADREKGFYDILFVGHSEDGDECRGAMKGNLDPGYGSTSRMIAQIALGLLLDEAPPGISTPTAALRQRIADRFQQHDVMRFALEHVV